LDYKGTVLLVSHDRAFLDNVVTSTFAFEGDGVVASYVGGYQDWLRQRPEPQKAKAVGKGEAPKAEVKTQTKPEAVVTEQKKTKLSYKLQRELEQLPALLEAAEAELAALQEETANPDFYSKEHSYVTERLAAMAAQEKVVEDLMERWVELEAM